MLNEKFKEIIISELILFENNNSIYLSFEPEKFKEFFELMKVTEG